MNRTTDSLMKNDDSHVTLSEVGGQERQGWVRFVLPHLVTRLTWQRGTQTYREVVGLVNVSAVASSWCKSTFLRTGRS